MVNVAEHYDLLIENGNDPLLDSAKLCSYMDKWDGQVFIDELGLSSGKSVLEVGCGTGRLAKKIINSIENYVGIDISPKTIERAEKYFAKNPSMRFICGDFLGYRFNRSFDVVYSTLTFMHIENKKSAIDKIFDVMNDNGKVVISIDKNQSRYIDTGYSKIHIYPDDPIDLQRLLSAGGFTRVKVQEIEFAFILSAYK